MEHSAPTISLVVPAYNEEKRIASTISALSTYLCENFSSSELIVVCDGCKDKTADVARSSFVSGSCQLRIIEIVENQGKGNAVKEGFLAAQGEYQFFTDADLSFAPEVLSLLLAALTSGADVAVVQRKKETKYPSLARRIVALGSRWLIGNFILPGLRDTQAGFKGFKRDAARQLFAVARIKRFLFDMEILLIARQRGYRIDKVFVDWVDRPGSTVQIVLDTSRSLRDLMLIMFWSAIGQYRPK